MLEPLGEGFYALWGGGKDLEHSWASGDADEPVAWDKPAPPPKNAVVGWWVRLKLKNGNAGWVRDPEFECMGALAGDTGCRD
jgi:hypothetical protein